MGDNEWPWPEEPELLAAALAALAAEAPDIALSLPEALGLGQAAFEGLVGIPLSSRRKPRCESVRTRIVSTPIPRASYEGPQCHFTFICAASDETCEGQHSTEKSVYPRDQGKAKHGRRHPDPFMTSTVQIRKGSRPNHGGRRRGAPAMFHDKPDVGHFERGAD